VNDEALKTANAVRRGITAMARRLRALRAEHGVSPAKLSLLGRLYRSGQPMSAVDLARLERLQPQSLTRLIADLDGRGFIHRRPHPSDGRQLLIELTPSGGALLIDDARRQNEWLAGVMQASLTATENDFLRLTAALLERLADVPPVSEDG